MRRKKESSLIRRSRQGDTAAFGEIIRRYQHLVFATAFQVVKNPTLAEDVAQEAFVTAFQSLK
ncbi:MAG: RNA polymerase subunit sigma-24, partial [Deltaproteobacteria bacterium]